MLTLDLFGDDLAPVPAKPQPVVQPAPPAEIFMMQPCGLNLWTYRGVKVTCDMKRKGLIGHWSTVEALDGEIRKSDLRVVLCKHIDELLQQGKDGQNG